MGQTTPLPTKCCNTNGIKCSATRITEIDWSDKGLKNSIPSEIEKLTGLTSLELYYNLLSGPIPPALGNLVNLKVLSLDNNELTGPIPSSFGNLKSIKVLMLSSNRLSGQIPFTLGKLKNIEQFDLHENQLDGPIPSTFEKWTKIKFVDLGFNRLSGSIPSTFAYMESLEEIFLDHNQLSGPIPSRGNLINLITLWINDNQLTGSIPSILGMMEGLQSLFLYNNKLTGYHSSLKTPELQIFPNPMPDVPYDKVARASVGTLSTVSWDPFFNATVKLSKRQQTQSGDALTTEELVRMCPLNSLTELSAGCIAGIYNRYCRNSKNLVQCHKAFDDVFAASKFKSLGAVCPAWKRGPNSDSCLREVAAFTATLEMSKVPPEHITLNSVHAEELRKNIFADPKRAPCVTSKTIQCTWGATSA